MIFIDNVISELLNVSMKCINDMIDANTIIGTPIIYNNTTIIPVSRVHLGFLSGGTDIKDKKDTPLFGGGTGGGLSLAPLAFLVVKDDDIRLIAIDNETHMLEKIVDIIPNFINKCNDIVSNNFNEL